MPVSQRKFIATYLITGQTYRVIMGFKDYDAVVYPVDASKQDLTNSFAAHLRSRRVRPQQRRRIP